MKSVLFFFLVVVATYSMNGQDLLVSGYTMSAEQSLPFTNIRIDHSDRGTTSDENGYFEIFLEQGSHTLIFSYVGFIPVKKQIIVDDESELALTIELKENTALKEVVVTATMKTTYVSKSPIKVDVVTDDHLNTFLPAAASSIVEGIQLVGGVQEVVACGVCYTNSLSINGLEGAYTAILMDGTPIYGNLASVYGLNGIPNMIIDRFEVIKGPSSTLYGSEAVAGVINIITKDPEDQPIASIDIMGTSHRESFGNIALAPVWGKLSGYVGLNYAYINDFDDDNNDGFGDNINLDRYSFFTKWKLQRPDNRQFHIAAKYYYEDRRNGVEEYLIDRAYKTLRGSEQIYGESIYTKRAELFGTYEFKSQLPLKVDFSMSSHNQNSFYGSDFYEASQKIAFSNLTLNLNPKNHDILIGLTQRYQVYDDNTIATEVLSANGQKLNMPDNQFIPGLFVQDEISVNSKLTLLAGGRMDHYSSHGLIFSPRLSTKWKMSEWTTLRGNFGTGFRIVNLFTEDHAFISGQREVEIVEELQPEKSVTGSVNLNHVFALGPGTGSLDIESFYTRFSNKIVPDYSEPGKIIYANSSGFARTYGIGATINYNFSFPLSLQFAYNRQSVQETDKDQFGNNSTRDIEFAPKWSSIFLVNYSWEKANLSIGYTARITGPMALPEVFDLDEEGLPLSFSRPTVSESFGIHNFQVSHQTNESLSIYFGIQNLLNYRQSISPLIGFNDPQSNIGFSDYFDTTYSYSTLHGREYYIGAKWNLNRRKNSN